MDIKSVNLLAFEGMTLKQIEKMVSDCNIDFPAKEIYKNLTNKGKAEKPKKSKEA